MIDPLDPTRRKILKGSYETRDLLEPIFRKGKRVYSLPSLSAVRDYTRAELNRFPVGLKRFLNPHEYIVGMEKSLYQLKVDLIDKIRHAH